MRTMPVVAVSEEGKFVGPLLGVQIGSGISPLSEVGLDEARGLDVGLGGVGPGADVLQPEPAAGVSEGEGSVAGAVVGHDALDGDAETCVVGDTGVEEGHRTSLAFIWFDLGEGDARGVIDADMNELPSHASAVALAGAIAGDAVADLVELAGLFA